MGIPIDGQGPLREVAYYPITGKRSNPMERPRIDTVIQMGVKAIDGLLTIGKGQRMGIFAGSGVGKSTLMGMIAKNVDVYKRQINDKWYLFVMGGYMLTGWQTKNGREYYLTTNGDMVTGWFQYNRVWYYLDPQVGKVSGGWLQQGDDWYYTVSYTHLL